MPILKNKDKDVYKVLLRDKIVGFFQADTWGQAQREAAGFYNSNKDKEDRLTWESFYALWVNPKHCQPPRPEGRGLQKPYRLG